MLSFANLNEAWGEVRKKPKLEAKKKQPENDVHCSPNFGSVCEPIVVRITDPGVIKGLSIYNDDYKQDIILDILKRGLHRNDEEQPIENKIQTIKPTNAPNNSIFDTIMKTFLDDEYKEIISVVLISIFLLFLIEGVKKYNRV